mgnify:CR=1 FL=1
MGNKNVVNRLKMPQRFSLLVLALFLVPILIYAEQCPKYNLGDFGRWIDQNVKSDFADIQDIPTQKGVGSDDWNTCWRIRR